MNYKILQMSNSLRPLAGIVLLLLLLTSCQSKLIIDEAAERNAILELHQQQRTFHFEKMTEAFADLLSENHISVNRGEINSPTQEENIERFGNYFNAVEFEKWDDINPPIIKFSDDYSMAYTIVDKEVIINFENADGNRERELTKFSWVAIYKRYDNGWKIDCVASTNKPSEKI